MVVVIGIPVLALLAEAAAYIGLTTVAVTAINRVRQPERQSPLAGRAVAIDAGHGGFDGGVSHGGLLEKDLALDVALRLGRQIEAAGGKPVLTRAEDVAYFEDNREDFDHRLKLAEEGKAEVLVSIHVNSFPDPSQFGGQVFYYPKSAEGRRLAVLLQAELVRLQPDNYREALAAEYYILWNSKVPAVLVEVGFLSNPGDRALLASELHREKLAEALRRGLERYFAGDRPGGLPPAPPRPTSRFGVPEEF